MADNERIISLSINEKEFNRQIDSISNQLSNFERNINNFENKVNKISLFNSFKNIDKNMTQSSKKITKEIQTIDNDLNKISDTVNNKVISSLNDLNDRFSFLGITGLKVVNDLSDSFLNFSKNIIMSMTELRNMQSAMTKFEQKNVAIRTIMNSITDDKVPKKYASTIDYVTDALSKLETFSDETSYDFTEMTQSIGKFVSMGNSLETAADTVLGMANWSSLVGKSAKDFNNLSYAIEKVAGLGYLGLREFQMTSTYFDPQTKKNILEQAASLGTLQKVSEDTYRTLEGHDVSLATFSTYLKDRWLTMDVLNGVMSKYSEFSNAVIEYMDQTGASASEAIKQLEKQYDSVSVKAFKSAQEAKTFGEAIESVQVAVTTGWAKSFEYIFGNVEEASELFTGIANQLFEIFSNNKYARNSMLSMWKDIGGRTTLVEAIIGDIKVIDGVEKRVGGLINNIAEYIKTIKNSIADVFGLLKDDATDEEIKGFAKYLNDITKNIKKLTSALKPTKKILDQLYSIIYFISSIIKYTFDIITRIASNIISFIKPIISYLYDIVSILSSVGYILISVIYNNILNIFSTIKSKLQPVITELYPLFNRIGGLIQIILRSLSLIAIPLDKIFKKVTSIFNSIDMTNVTTLIKNFVNNVINFINTIEQKYINFINKIDFSKLFEKIKDNKIFNTILNIFNNIFNTILIFVDNIKKVGIGQVFVNLFSSINNAINNIPILNNIKSIFLNIYNYIIKNIQDFISNIKDKGIIDATFELFTNIISDIITAITKIFNGFNISSIITKNNLVPLFTNIKLVFSKILGFAQQFLPIITSIIPLLILNSKKFNVLTDIINNALQIKVEESKAKKSLYNVQKIATILLSIIIGVGAIIYLAKEIKNINISDIILATGIVLTISALLGGLFIGIIKLFDMINKGDKNSKKKTININNVFNLSSLIAFIATLSVIKSVFITISNVLLEIIKIFQNNLNVNIIHFTAIIGSVISLVSIVGLLKSVFGKNKNYFNIEIDLSGLKNIFLDLAKFILAVKTIKSEEFPSLLLKMSGILLVLIGAITLFNFINSKFSKKEKNKDPFSPLAKLNFAGLISFIVGLNSISSSLISFAQQNAGKMVIAGATIISILAIISTISDNIAQMSTFVNSLTMLINTMLIALAALTLIKGLIPTAIGSVVLLSLFLNSIRDLKVDFNVDIKAIALMVLMIAELVGSMILLSNVMSGMDSLAFSAALLIMSYNFKVLANTLSESLPKISEGITKFITTMNQKSKSVSTFLSNIRKEIKLLVDFIVQMGPKILLSLLPIIPIVAVVIGTIYLLRDAIVNVFGLILELINNVINTIIANLPIIFESLSTFINTVLPTLSAFITTVWTVLVSTIPIVLQALSSFATTVLPVLSTFITTIWTVLVNTIPIVLQALSGFITSVLPALSAFITTVWTVFVNTIPTVLQALSAFITTVWPVLVNTIPIVLQALGDFIVQIFPVLPTLQNIIQIIAEALIRVAEILSGLIAYIFPQLTSFLQSIILPVLSMLDKILTPISSVLNTIADALKLLLTPIEKLCEFITFIIDGIMKLFDWIGKLFGLNTNDQVDKFKDNLKEHYEFTKEDEEEISNKLKESLENILNDITKHVSELDRSISLELVKIFSFNDDEQKNIKETVYKAYILDDLQIQNIKNNILDNIMTDDKINNIRNLFYSCFILNDDQLNSIKNQISSLTGNIKIGSTNNIINISKDIEKTTKNVDNVSKSINKNITETTNNAKTASDSLNKNIKDTNTNTTETFDNINDDIKETTDNVEETSEKINNNTNKVSDNIKDSSEDINKDLNNIANTINNEFDKSIEIDVEANTEEIDTGLSNVATNFANKLQNNISDIKLPDSIQNVLNGNYTIPTIPGTQTIGQKFLNFITGNNNNNNNNNNSNNGNGGSSKKTGGGGGGSKKEKVDPIKEHKKFLQNYKEQLDEEKKIVKYFSNDRKNEFKKQLEDQKQHYEETQELNDFFNVSAQNDVTTWLDTLATGYEASDELFKGHLEELDENMSAEDKLYARRLETLKKFYEEEKIVDSGMNWGSVKVSEGFKQETSNIKKHEAISNMKSYLIAYQNFQKDIEYLAGTNISQALLSAAYKDGPNGELFLAIKGMADNQLEAFDKVWSDVNGYQTNGDSAWFAALTARRSQLKEQHKTINLEMGVSPENPFIIGKQRSKKTDRDKEELKTQLDEAQYEIEKEIEKNKSEIQFTPPVFVDPNVTTNAEQTGYNIVTNMASGMQEALPTLQNTVTQVSAMVNTQTIDPNTAVQNVATNNLSNLEVKIAELKATLDAVLNITSTLSNGITQLLNTSFTGEGGMFEQGGQNIDASIAKGITDNTNVVITAINNMLNAAINEANSLLGIASPSKKFFEIGEYITKGLANGIESGRSTVVSAMVDKVLASMSDEAEDEEEINSPSKKWMRFGEFIDEGLKNGILENSNSPLNALRDMLNNISEDMEYDEEYNPVITPVIDLDSVRKQAQGISTLFASDQALNVSTEMQSLRANQNGGKFGSSSGNSYTFTQNNYSPKELSRAEIYRQTNNQFSQIKTLLEK